MLPMLETRKANQETRNAKSATSFHRLTKGLPGLALVGAASLVSVSLVATQSYAQSYAPGQYPQSPPQTNGQYQGPAFPSQIAGQSASVQNTLEPVFVKRHDFNIPLNINTRGANRPAEVQLFVSRDSGRSWEFYSRETPDAGHFSFSAPSDGEYWFAVRPGFGGPNATLASAATLAPSLRVAVDTSQPSLDLDASAEASGTTTVNFTVRDNAPMVSGIQIYYRTDTPEASWLLLDSNRINWLRNEGGQLTGQIGFDPQVDWRRISLHIVATDMAGNQATAQRVIERPRVAGTPAMLASAPQNGFPGSQFRQIPVVPTQAPGQVPNPAQPGNYGPPQDQSDNGYAVVIPQPPTNAYARPAAPQSVNAAYDTRYQGPGDQGPNYQENAIQTPEYRGFSARPTVNNPSSASAIQPSSSIQPPSSAFRALEVETLPAPNNRTKSNVSTDAAQGLATSDVGDVARQLPSQPPASAEITQKLPVDESELNYSRQGEFSLDYEFDSLGSRGIKKIELWGTRDAGQTWDYWGEDPDSAPPFDVVTQGQGLYGFRIVAVDSHNLTSPTPQPGDEPEIYILVDKTAPIVKLVSASYGEGAEAGALVIEYTYSDANPIARPISLSFSDSPSGPWTTIATGLENSGRYVWPADPRLPKNMYLRVEATDRAGNTGIEVSSTPISLRGLAPTARIKGFQPLTQDR